MNCSELKVSAATRVYYDLSRKIRDAEQPDNPMIIREFLNLEPLPVLKNKAVLRVHLVKQFQLLIDTICDEYLPSYWRRQCLDHIYLPLRSLARLATCRQSREQLRFLNYELQVLSHYFQAGLVAS